MHSSTCVLLKFFVEFFMFDKKIENIFCFLRNKTEAHLLKSVTFLTVVLSIVIAGAKVFAWQKTHSVAFKAVAFDSFFDLFSSFLSFFAIRISLKKPTASYPFGFSKVESLMSLFQSFFIFVIAIFLLYNSFEGFYKAPELESLEFGMGVTMGCLVGTLLLMSYQLYVVNRTKSHLIHAELVHYMGDFLIEVSLFVSMIFLYFFHVLWVDSFLGLCIAIYMGASAVKIFTKSLVVLLDGAIPQDERQRLLDIVERASAPGVIKHMRTRFSGLKQFIEVEIELSLSQLNDAHNINNHVRGSVAHTYPKATVMVHILPPSS